MVFKVLSKEDWESEGFIGGVLLGIDSWVGGVDLGSVNGLGSVNDWGEGDIVLISDAYFWEKISVFCGR